MKKKLLSILLVLSLMLALVPAAFAADIAASGTCGAEGDGSNVPVRSHPTPCRSGN